MLTITPTASDAIRQLVDAAELPESGGIRIAQGQVTDEGTAVELALVEAPIEDDQVVVNEGAAVYVDQELTVLLDDKVLDAQMSEGQVAFALVQDEAPPEGGTTNGRVT